MNRSIGKGTTSSALGIVLGATLAFVGIGCGSDPAQKTPDSAANKAGTTKNAGLDTKSATSGSIHIDDKILKACGDLPTAHFAFDSATVAGDADVALSALAHCFVAGPLKGKGMKLIGHTDQRGETEYNLALGQRRSGSVADFLSKKGLEKGRIFPSSMGEFGATGTDESGWAKDRKVDVLLAE